MPIPYPVRFALAVILFGLTLAFTCAGVATAVVDLHMGTLVWENDVVYPLLAVGFGAALLAVAHTMLPRATHMQLVQLEDVFPNA